MQRKMYSPRLSDEVVRSLYREGQLRRIPMTRLADALLRQALGLPAHAPVQIAREGGPAHPTDSATAFHAII